MTWKFHILMGSCVMLWFMCTLLGTLSCLSGCHPFKFHLTQSKSWSNSSNCNETIIIFNIEIFKLQYQHLWWTFKVVKYVKLAIVLQLKKLKPNDLHDSAQEMPYESGMRGREKQKFKERAPFQFTDCICSLLTHHTQFMVLND